MKQYATSSNASRDWINEFDKRVAQSLKTRGDTLQNMGGDNPQTPKGN